MDIADYAPDQEPLANPSVIALAALTGFYFAFRLFIILLSVRLLGTDPQTGAMLNLMLNILLLLAVALQTLGTFGPAKTPLLRLPSVRWVALFLAFSCCSLAWSVTASLPAAIAYWFAMAADVAIVVLLLRASPVVDVTDSLMKGYIWGACAVAVIAWILPAQSDLRLGDEELLGPNQIGYLCAFAFFFAQYRIRARRGSTLAAVLLAVTLLRTLSKTTIVAFVVAELFLLIRDKSIARKTKWKIAATASIVILLFWSLLVSYWDIYMSTGSGNNAETLTGRVDIWAVILTEAIQRPWFGHGFHSVWKVIPSFGEFEARHAHNELLQQFYAYGVTGIILIAGLYGSLYRQARKLAQAPLKMFLTALLIFVLVRGLAESDPFDLSLPLWGIVIFSLLIQNELAAKTSPATAAGRHVAADQGPLRGVFGPVNVIPL